MEKNEGMFAELEKVLTELVSGKEPIPKSRIIQVNYSMDDTIKEMEGMKEKIKSYIPKVKVDINPPKKNIVSDAANEISDMVSKQRDELIQKQIRKMANDTIKDIKKQVGINYEEVKKDFDIFQKEYTKEHLDNWLIDFRKRTKKSDDVQIDLSDKLRDIKEDTIIIDVISKPEDLGQDVYEMTQEQVDFYNGKGSEEKEEGCPIVVRVKDGEVITLRPGEYVISVTNSNKAGYDDYLIGKNKVLVRSIGNAGSVGVQGLPITNQDTEIPKWVSSITTKKEPKIIIDNFYHDVYYYHNFYIEINNHFFKVTFDNANLNESRFCNITISKKSSEGYHYDEMFKTFHNAFYPEGKYSIYELDPKEVESKNREKLKEIITMLEGLTK